MRSTRVNWKGVRNPPTSPRAERAERAKQTAPTQRPSVRPRARQTEKRSRVHDGGYGGTELGRTGGHGIARLGAELIQLCRYGLIIVWPGACLSDLLDR